MELILAVVKFAELIHGITHLHEQRGRDGLGDFEVCYWRIPWWPRCTVYFRPDYSHAAWHKIPNRVDADGVGLLDKMLKAGSAEEAMALLRAKPRDIAQLG